MVLLWELLQLDIIDSGPEFHEDCHLHRAGWAQGLALDLGSARWSRLQMEGLSSLSRIQGNRRLPRGTGEHLGGASQWSEPSLGLWMKYDKHLLV